MLPQTKDKEMADDKDKDKELKEKDIIIKEKDAVIKEQEAVIRVLRRRASPRSLGYYRSRFNAPSES